MPGFPWLPFERRWREALLVAALPPLAAHARDGFWERVAEAAPPIARLGVRVAVWALTLSPPLLIGRWRTFGALNDDERDLVLVRAASHRWYPVRQLADLVKLMACFALFRHREVRAPMGVPGGSAP